MKDRMNVDIEGGVPRFGCEVEKTARHWPASGMDENIDLTEALFNGGNAPVGFGGNCDVSLNQFAAPAKLSDFVPDILGLAVDPPSRQRHVRPLACKRNACGSANPAGSAGD